MPLFEARALGNELVPVGVREPPPEPGASIIILGPQAIEAAYPTDPDNLDVDVRPHGDGGFCLEVRMFDPVAGASGISLRQVQGLLIGEDGSWETEGEARATADDLREWWKKQ